MHVSIKINSSDFEKGGNDENDCVEICKILEKEGIDSIEISANNSSHMKIKPHVNEAYFLDCAKKVAEAVNVPIALVGGIRSRKTMQNILDNTKIQIISLSRPLNCDYEYPKKCKVEILKILDAFLAMDAINRKTIDVLYLKRKNNK